MNIFTINKEYNATGQITIKTGKCKLLLGEPEAEFYFSRVGITDYNTRKDIYDYIKGLKDLNLWQYTINTFLLSSGYNSNSNVVYDLKNKNYDGKIINYNQTEWTPSGIHLKSGYGVSDIPSVSSGKGVIVHPKLPVLSGNCTFVMLGKTLVNSDNRGMGAWWQQASVGGSDRSIWFFPDAYFSSSEMQFGGNYYDTNVGNLPTYPFYWKSQGVSAIYSSTKLSTGQQYNIISYSNPYNPSYIPNSGTGSIAVYKDGKFIAETSSGIVTLPQVCEFIAPNYPCWQYSGCIGGIYGDPYPISVKNDGFYTIAASFSKVLNSGEHLALHKLIKNTISKNININI